MVLLDPMFVVILLHSPTDRSPPMYVKGSSSRDCKAVFGYTPRNYNSSTKWVLSTSMIVQGGGKTSISSTTYICFSFAPALHEALGVFSGGDTCVKLHVQVTAVLKGKGEPSTYDGQNTGHGEKPFRMSNHQA